VKIDPGTHKGMHLVLALKLGVTGPNDQVPGSKILPKNDKIVKFRITLVIGSKTLNRKQILKNVGINKNIVEIKCPMIIVSPAEVTQRIEPLPRMIYERVA
jgi:hypothetical protein